MDFSFLVDKDCVGALSGNVTTDGVDLDLKEQSTPSVLQQMPSHPVDVTAAGGSLTAADDASLVASSPLPPAVLAAMRRVAESSTNAKVQKLILATLASEMSDTVTDLDTPASDAVTVTEAPGELRAAAEAEVPRELRAEAEAELMHKLDVAAKRKFGEAWSPQRKPRVETPSPDAEFCNAARVRKVIRVPLLAPQARPPFFVNWNRSPAPLSERCQWSGGCNRFRKYRCIVCKKRVCARHMCGRVQNSSAECSDCQEKPVRTSVAPVQTASAILAKRTQPRVHSDSAVIAKRGRY